MGNYTTRKEIDEMRELQQVTSTGHRSAKRCRFYRVELLNGSNIGCGENGRQIDGNGTKQEIENARRKKRKARKALITSEKKEKEKRKHKKKQKET